jgi:hypothetical protein
MKTKPFYFNFIIAFTFILFTSNSFSQNTSASNDSTKTTKKWQYLGELYLMFPNMKGDLGLGSLPDVSIDPSASDLLGQLKFGAMVYLEAGNENWAISSDFIYMKLEKGVEPNKVVASGEVSLEELAWELAGFRKIKPWLDLGIGARLISLNAGLDLQTKHNPKEASTSETWVDPIIVMRTQNYITEKLFWQLRGDLGGFGIGSDFTWQAQANVGYRFSKLFQASVGYRYLAIDYNNEEQGSDRLLYDIDTYGGVVRLGFNF